MKHLKEYAIQKIFEAPVEVKQIISGLFKFNKETTNEEIIDTILHDFSLKCALLIKESYAPNCALNSLCTYDLFMNRYGINNPGDVTADIDAEMIYSEIPSDICSKYIYDELIDNQGYAVLSEKEIKSMFSTGEFPVIRIWKGYHQALDEIHITYAISR